MSTQSDWYRARRLGGLRRFAIAITVLNILGHAFFGFEQSYAAPLVGVGTAYTVEILLELVGARVQGRKPAFLGGFGKLIDFLLSAHISGLACSMLLYPNARLEPIAFAAAVAIGSKAIFRIPLGNGTRHVFNPSNLGITATLLLFPWVGIVPPYHFAENLVGIGDFILPGIIIASGTFLNARFTGRLPLIAGWLGGFFLQALLRNLLFDAGLEAALMPMTGVAFVLYTFYMITDPATTPEEPKCQVAFGMAVAGMYGVLMINHIVFGLFFALSIVCALRGISIYTFAWYKARTLGRTRVQAPAVVGGKEV